MSYVICSCCGDSVKDTKKENADYAERGQDKGFGTCFSCVEDMMSKPEPLHNRKTSDVFIETASKSLQGAKNKAQKIGNKTTDYEYILIEIVEINEVCSVPL